MSNEIRVFDVFVLSEFAVPQVTTITDTDYMSALNAEATAT